MSELTQISPEQNVTDKIIICIEGQDWIQDLGSTTVTFDSTETEILESVRSGIQEKFSVDIKDETSGWLYKVRKATDNRNIYILPNSTAGF